jgi:hypothetical protein
LSSVIVEGRRGQLDSGVPLKRDGRAQRARPTVASPTEANSLADNDRDNNNSNHHKHEPRPQSSGRPSHNSAKLVHEFIIILAMRAAGPLECHRASQSASQRPDSEIMDSIITRSRGQPDPDLWSGSFSSLPRSGAARLPRALETGKTTTRR